MWRFLGTELPNLPFLGLSKSNRAGYLVQLYHTLDTIICQFQSATVPSPRRTMRLLPARLLHPGKYNLLAAA
jgi:hypothetical protein